MFNWNEKCCSLWKIIFYFFSFSVVVELRVELFYSPFCHLFLSLLWKVLSWTFDCRMNVYLWKKKCFMKGRKWREDWESVEELERIWLKWKGKVVRKTLFSVGGWSAFCSTKDMFSVESQNAHLGVADQKGIWSSTENFSSIC